MDYDNILIYRCDFIFYHKKKWFRSFFKKKRTAAIKKTINGMTVVLVGKRLRSKMRFSLQYLPKLSIQQASDCVIMGFRIIK